jgi:delta 1-pyrroline-5-carboxylate dehydrogenase
MASGRQGVTKQRYAAWDKEEDPKMTELATPPVEEHTGVTRISHWIGGRTVAGTSGRTSPVYNPATGRQTGALDLATVDEVDQAVQTAKEAFESWRSVSLAKRAELFFNIRELVH